MRVLGGIRALREDFDRRSEAIERTLQLHSERFEAMDRRFEALQRDMDRRFELQAKVPDRARSEAAGARGGHGGLGRRHLPDPFEAVLIAPYADRRAVELTRGLGVRLLMETETAAESDET